MKPVVIYTLLIICSPLLLLGRITPAELSPNIQNAKNNTIEGANSNKKLFKYYYHIGKRDSAIHFAKNRIQIGKYINSREDYLDAIIDVGIAFGAINEPDSAVYYYNQIFDLTETAKDTISQRQRANAIMLYGAILMGAEKAVDEAFPYFTEARSLAQEYGETYTYVRSSVAILSNYYQKKRYDDFLRILNEAYEYLEEKEKEDTKIIHMLNHYKAKYLAKHSKTASKKKEGLDLLLDAHEYHDKKFNYQARAYYFITIASFYHEDLSPERFMELAEINFQEGKNILVESAKGGLYQAYARALIKNQKYQESIPFLLEAKELLNGHKHRDEYLSNCELLMQTYQITGQYDKIIPEFEDYKVFQEAYIAKNYSDKLLDLEEKYETQIKESENKELKQANELASSKANLYGIIGLLLLAILGFAAYFYYKLSKAKNKLVRINSAKNRLFAVLAHDLKGPAMSFQELTSNVSYLIRQNQPKRLLELAEYFENSGEQVNRILTNLLDWAISQKDEFELKPQPINVKEEVEKIMKDLEYITRYKKIDIKASLPEDFKTTFDKNSFSIIVRNLLHNAIKYSHKDSEIKINLYKQSGKQELQVIDYGVGISNELIKKINTGEVTESIAGTDQELGNALGLSTCFSLAERNNSSIQVNSQEGNGSIFSLVLD